MPTIEVKSGVLNPYVLQLADDRSPLVMVKGGAGAGKSVGVGQILVARCMIEGCNVLVLRKYSNHARSSVFLLVRSIISHWQTKRLFRINNTTMSFTFLPNGAEIRCAGCDDPDSLKSIVAQNGQSYGMAWLEEADQFLPEDLRQVRLRLRGPSVLPKQIWLTFNPVSQFSWLKVDLVDTNAAGLSVHTYTHRDNIFMEDADRAVIEGLAESSPNDYRVYGLGEWGLPGNGMIFPNNWFAIGEGVFDSLPESGHEDIFGLDFGFVAPMALVHYKIEKSYIQNGMMPSVYAKQVMYSPGMQTTDAFAMLKRIRNWRGIPLYCDCAEPDRIEELRGWGAMAIPWKKGILASIEFCKRVPLAVCGAEMVKELGGYAWDARGGDRVAGGQADHAVDTFRGAVWTHLMDKVDYRRAAANAARFAGGEK